MYEIKKNQYHEDDRAQRYLDVFKLPDSQINASVVNSTSHVVAWHKHDIQTDYFFCIKGAFKVGLAYLKDDGVYEVKWEYISEKNQKSIKIPPGVYHGYKATIPNSIMLYYLTEKYNPKDEIKVKPGYFGEDWRTENK
tara:strand:- start:240 stop:653 length:414 start_codon:yes stop_codon:yes gene_type:complete